MSAMFLHHLHARDVSLSISEVNHAREGDRALVVGHELVDLRVIAHLLDTFVDLEDKLSLGGVVDGDSRPEGAAILVVKKRAGIDVFKFMGDRGTLYHLLESRRVDIVLDVETDTFTIFIDEREPLLDTTEEFHVLTEALERFTCQGDIVFLRLVEHEVHIGKDSVGILALRELAVFLPEFLLRLAGSLNESKLLHVTWRERPVEIINQCYYRSFLCHTLLI